MLLLLALALAEDAPVEAPSFHQSLPCATCHESTPEADTPPKPTVPDLELCKACHTPTPHAGASIHLGPLPEGMKAQLEASALRISEQGEVVCMSCHDPHTQAPKLMRLKPDTGELCRACHSSSDMDAEPPSRSP